MAVGVLISAAPERTVRVRTSRDGGYVFSDWRDRLLGKEGSFLVPVVFRRFGSARHFTMEVSVLSSAPFTIIGASVQVEPGGP